MCTFWLYSYDMKEDGYTEWSEADWLVGARNEGKEKKINSKGKFGDW